MPLVTVKPKFQVTIPAKLRRGIDLREGDIMEATLVGDGILFRPKEVVDRDAAADRIAAKLAAAQP
ncbi:MAG: AbrB/MazE/SpoVT family DNA-binding domain-containing protein, partial [Acidobacteriota bacterium]|nr:AbrB/MazE/SpoVT family DNA-binding domain-containing protein [Acidobacteriota bacterium]